MKKRKKHFRLWIDGANKRKLRRPWPKVKEWLEHLKHKWWR